MTRVFAETSSALPLISVCLSFRAGRVHDPDGKGGVALATAQMLRRGAGGMTAPQIEQRLDQLGAELGQHAGLGTSSFSFDMLTRSRGEVADLIATLLAEPTFDDKELGRLKRQTLADLVQARDSDAHLAGRSLRRAVLGAHPHAERASGNLASVARIARDDIATYHRRHYCRANAVIGVAGDLRDQQVDELASALLARLPDGEPSTYEVPEPEPLEGIGLVFVDKPERTQCQLVIGTQGTHPMDDDHDALMVANAAFGGTFTSRMTQEIRAERGWSYNASSSLSYGRRRELFSMWTGPSVEDAPACLAHQLKMLSRWHEQGLTDKEIDFCVGYLCRSYAFEIDTPRKRVQQKLEAALLDLPEGYFEGYKERTQAVTAEAASAAVAARIDPKRLRVAAVGSGDDACDALTAALERAVGVDATTARVPYDAVD